MKGVVNFLLGVCTCAMLVFIDRAVAQTAKLTVTEPSTAPINSILVTCKADGTLHMKPIDGTTNYKP